MSRPVSAVLPAAMGAGAGVDIAESFKTADSTDLNQVLSFLDKPQRLKLERALGRRPLVLDQVITDVDCKHGGQHCNVNGWFFKLRLDGTFYLVHDWEAPASEGESSDFGYREWGRYVLGGGQLLLSATRAREYGGQGQPVDDSGESTEWMPCQPSHKGCQGLVGANVDVRAETFTICWEKAVDCEDVDAEQKKVGELREVATSFSNQIDELSKQFDRVSQKDILEALVHTEGDTIQATPRLQGEQEALSKGLDAACAAHQAKVKEEYDLAETKAEAVKPTPAAEGYISAAA